MQLVFNLRPYALNPLTRMLVTNVTPCPKPQQTISLQCFSGAYKSHSYDAEFGFKPGYSWPGFYKTRHCGVGGDFGKV